MPAPYPYTSNVSFTEPGTYKYNPSGWGAVTVAAEATAAMSLRGEAQSAYVNTYLDVQWGQAADGYVMRFHWFNTSLAEAHAVEIFKTQGAEPGPMEWNPPRWTRLANSRLTKIWGWVPWEVCYTPRPQDPDYH